MLAVSYAKAGDLPAARETAQRLLYHLPHLTIQYLAAPLPPMSKGIRDDYFPYLVMAGIPEE
ncbi:MAG: hypothetical protein QNL54_01635 [Rhodobacterales bacterium]|jgi:hypothetical protein